MGGPDTGRQGRRRGGDGGTAPRRRTRRLRDTVDGHAMTVVHLGAPGVYRAPVASAAAGVEPVRLDVAGLVGIAPRGPVNEPVVVQSAAEYLRRFGADGPPARNCPGRLTDATAAFF